MKTNVVLIKNELKYDIPWSDQLYRNQHYTVYIYILIELWSHHSDSIFRKLQILKEKWVKNMKKYNIYRLKLKTYIQYICCFWRKKNLKTYIYVCRLQRVKRINLQFIFLLRYGK